jgi:phospholipid-translocating ATPase
MVFRQCSVGGKAYEGDSPPPGNGEEDENTHAEPPLLSEAPSSVNNDFQTIVPSSQTSDIAMVPSSNLTSGARDSRAQFKDTALLQDLENALSDNPDPQIETHARLLNGFFTVLALCHTVLTSANPDTGELEYKAQSPDEAALVQAAADVGFVFCGRDKEMLSLRTPSTAPDVEKYELLNILEFTSARKRMSVVLRKLGEDGRLFLLTKGADNVIFERLRSSEEELRAQTEVHLNQFANEGLRTLTLAYKVIGGE